MQMGYAPEDWVGRPVIAILNTWSDINPCHAHFKQRVEDVKRGVFQAGGFPVELPAISLAENFVKPTTMLYRNMLAMDTEELIRSHPVDGVVLMGGCDKTTPGLLLGATSMNLPTIYIPAGPMLRGNWKGRALGSGSDAWKYWDERRAGNITKDDWVEVEGGIARSHGHCMTMGTASTMTAIAESIGMTCPAPPRFPPPTSIISACAPRLDAAPSRWSGRISPRQDPDAPAFENAIAVAMAMGCSTNAVIHLIAMARRAGHDVGLDDFEIASRKVPVIANVRPSGTTYLMEDFYFAGGLPALMTRIRDRLHLDAVTVNGKTLGENIARAEVYNDDVIRTVDNAIYEEGALAVLKGNLAPDGCVIKPSACEPRLLKHSGPALVFDDYPSMKAVDRPRRPRRHRRSLSGPAQCRSAGRPRHAGMGHAADPEEAGEAGRARHAAPVRCPHERHELRRLHPARLAGGASAGRSPSCAPATSSRSTFRRVGSRSTSPTRNSS